MAALHQRLEFQMLVVAAAALVAEQVILAVQVAVQVLAILAAIAAQQVRQGKATTVALAVRIAVKATQVAVAVVKAAQVAHRKTLIKRATVALVLNGLMATIMRVAAQEKATVHTKLVA
jgi:hypothetical protein